MNMEDELKRLEDRFNELETSVLLMIELIRKCDKCFPAFKRESKKRKLK